MKTLPVIAMMAAVAGTAAARNIETGPGTVIPVCVEVAISGWTAMAQAKGIASKMFTEVGVTIQWRAWDRCPANGLKVSLVNKSEPTDHPNAYAYALPYEGTHIVVFWDRIEAVPEARAHAHVLAHVLAHEITHIVEGFPHHSGSGVMKASFGLKDVGQMECHPLPFAPEDVELIRMGLQIRRIRLAEKALQAHPPIPVDAAVMREAEVNAAPL